MFCSESGPESLAIGFQTHSIEFRLDWFSEGPISFRYSSNAFMIVCLYAGVIQSKEQEWTRKDFNRYAREGNESERERERKFNFTQFKLKIRSESILL